MEFKTGKPHPMELRERVAAYVDDGHTVTVRRPGILGASPEFVNDPVKPRRETGSLTPRPQGNGGGHGSDGLDRGPCWREGRDHTR